MRGLVGTVCLLSLFGIKTTLPLVELVPREDKIVVKAAQHTRYKTKSGLRELGDIFNRDKILFPLFHNLLNGLSTSRGSSSTSMLNQN